MRQLPKTATPKSHPCLYHQDHVGGLMPLLGIRWMTGDAAPSPAVTSLAKGADLLISEVIDVSATTSLVEHWTPLT